LVKNETPNEQPVNEAWVEPVVMDEVQVPTEETKECLKAHERR
jgi:hypothetical protein